MREDEVTRSTWTASHRVCVWTTSRFQKNETGFCHNERIRPFAAEYSVIVLK